MMHRNRHTTVHQNQMPHAHAPSGVCMYNSCEPYAVPTDGAQEPYGVCTYGSHELYAAPTDGAQESSAISTYGAREPSVGSTYGSCALSAVSTYCAQEPYATSVQSQCTVRHRPVWSQHGSPAPTMTPTAAPTAASALPEATPRPTTPCPPTRSPSGYASDRLRCCRHTRQSHATQMHAAPTHLATLLSIRHPLSPSLSLSIKYGPSSCRHQCASDSTYICQHANTHTIHTEQRTLMLYVTPVSAPAKQVSSRGSTISTGCNVFVLMGEIVTGMPGTPEGQDKSSDCTEQ
ncbi:hypothetical protein JB92DRAFT_355568 [Gautieria morchelliformis]|nr:hypothetical protein JB92DRAFT_355568 [Gautieria morchelliformis]